MCVCVCVCVCMSMCSMFACMYASILPHAYIVGFFKKMGKWLTSVKIGLFELFGHGVKAEDESKGNGGQSEGFSLNRAESAPVCARLRVSSAPPSQCHIATAHATQQRGCRSVIGSSESLSYLARMTRDEIKRDT